MKKTENPKENKFFYFAYCSHMSNKRMRRDCPSAEFICIGRIDNYRLDFINFDQYWGGPLATKVLTANAHLWGVVWKISKEDSDSLNRKKLDNGKYYAHECEVLTSHMGKLTCRAYEQKLNPLPRSDNEEFPSNQLPSYTYKKIIILGATQHRLPDYYIKYLKGLRDNGDRGCVRMNHLINVYAKGTPCDCTVPGVIERNKMKLDAKDMKRNAKFPAKQYNKIK